MSKIAIDEKELAYRLGRAYLDGAQEHQIASRIAGTNHDWGLMASDYGNKTKEAIKEEVES